MPTSPTGLIPTLERLTLLARSSASGIEYRRHESPRVLRPAGVAADVFFVIEGEVRTYQVLDEDRRWLIAISGPGEWAGLEALPGIATSTSLHVARRTLVGVIPIPRLLTLLANDPRANLELIEYQAQCLEQARRQAFRQMAFPAEHQILHAMLVMSTSSASLRENSHVTLLLTQQDIADAVGVARETMNGALQRLADTGLITKARGRITFSEPAVRKVLGLRSPDNGSKSGI